MAALRLRDAPLKQDALAAECEFAIHAGIAAGRHDREAAARRIRRAARWGEEPHGEGPAAGETRLQPPTHGALQRASLILGTRPSPT